MALILHLSDLHLGQRASDEDIDDHKMELVPSRERVRRQSLLESTLRALGRHLVEQGRKLDAIAVTGDTTLGDDPVGYDKFRSLLSELGDARPERSTIAVIPGNHDVTWQKPPSSSERYAHFLDGVRSHGYVTPLLDGTDLPRACDPSRHSVVLDGGRILLLPVNSANYSGALAKIPGVSENHLDALLHAVGDPDARAELARAIRQMRLHDVARVSPNQLEALDELLRALDRAGTTNRQTVKIALIHHQLLPVSTREEFKSFDSLTNLGLVREFLRSHGFSAVLHGHKHESRFYWDFVTAPRATDGLPPARPLFVVSGSTLGGVDYSRDEVARLLEVDVSTTAPTIAVTPVPAVDPGHPLASSALRRRRVPLPPPADGPARAAAPTLIVGGDIDSTYDRIMTAMTFAKAPTHNLVVTVAQLPDTPVSLPTAYPDVPDHAGTERDAWLEDMVRWWQRSTTELDTFTHGERIRAYGEDEVDQLKLVIEELSRKAVTSRGVVVLVNPQTDAHSKYPSFCLAQFSTTKRTPDCRTLDVTAYYRRQEMRYWWAVNVAELDRLARTVLAGVSQHIPNLVLGSVTTIANVAYAGKTCPRVAVPLVDRMLDEEPGGLRRMALALLLGDTTSSSGEIKRDWDALLDDLSPSPDIDATSGVPVAGRGLRILESEVSALAEQAERPDIADIGRLFWQLSGVNESYRSQLADDRADVGTHARWRRDCQRIVADLRQKVADLWTR